MSEENKFPGENNTGHIWDEDLRELDNEPPTWWTIAFHASWIFVIVYTLLYPSWPLVNTHFKGLLGWTSIAEYHKDMQSIKEVRAPFENRIQEMAAADILADTELSQYVNASGKVLFGDNCSACHGAGGQGNVGFPVLADDDWLFGGSIDDIKASITGGRQAVMPGHAATLNDEQVNDLAQAVVDGNVTEVPAYIETGCIGCHGADGKGLSFMGSANLMDGIYRFTAQDQLESVKHTIKYGVNDPSHEQTRNAVMPAFGGGKLTDTEIKKLAVYVHKLGGGQ